MRRRFVPLLALTVATTSCYGAAGSDPLAKGEPPPGTVELVGFANSDLPSTSAPPAPSEVAQPGTQPTSEAAAPGTTTSTEAPPADTEPSQAAAVDTTALPPTAEQAASTTSQQPSTTAEQLVETTIEVETAAQARCSTETAAVAEYGLQFCLDMATKGCAEITPRCGEVFPIQERFCGEYLITQQETAFIETVTAVYQNGVRISRQAYPHGTTAPGVDGVAADYC